MSNVLVEDFTDAVESLKRRQLAMSTRVGAMDNDLETLVKTVIDIAERQDKMLERQDSLLTALTNAIVMLDKAGEFK